MYRDTLLALSRDTRFRTSEPLPHPLSERRNPACGDEIALHFLQDQGRLHRLRYHAQACAITLASAAAMATELDDAPLDTVRRRTGEALAYFNSTHHWTHDWGADTLPALGAVRDRPMRMACVRLPWLALHDALDAP